MAHFTELKKALLSLPMTSKQSVSHARANDSCHTVGIIPNQSTETSIWMSNILRKISIGKSSENLCTPRWNVD